MSRHPVKEEPSIRLRNPFDLIGKTDSDLEDEDMQEEETTGGGVNVMSLLILVKAQKKDASDKTKFDGRRPVTASPYLRRPKDSCVKIPLAKSLYWPKAPTPKDEDDKESKEEFAFAEPCTTQWLWKGLFRNQGTTPIKLLIAETVIFKDGEPFRWTYTDPKTGNVTKRPKKWLRQEQIKKHFTQTIHQLKKEKPDFPQMGDEYIVVQRVNMGTEVATTPLNKTDIDIFFKGEGSSKNAVASFQEYLPTRSNSNGASIYRVQYRKKLNSMPSFNVAVCFKTRASGRNNDDNGGGDAPPPPVESGGIGGDSGQQQNSNKGKFIKKQMKSYARKVNDKAILKTKDVLRYIEAIWKKEIVCIDCDFIVNLNDELVCVNFENIFAIDSQLVRPRDDSMDDEGSAPVMTNGESDCDPQCEGDYCNVVFEHGFEVKERQERENDWRTLWKSRTEEANVPVVGREYRTIAFKSIILARYERDIKEITKKRAVKLDQTFLPQATLSTDGGLTNIQPAMFYKRVTVCENCYKMYVKLDRVRDQHADHARKLAREAVRTEISELNLNRSQKIERMVRADEKRRAFEIKKEQERQALLQLAEDSNLVINNEGSRSSLRSPPFPAHLNSAANTAHMSKHPVTTGVSPYYDKKTMYNVTPQRRRKTVQDIPKKPSIRKRMEAEMDRQISKFLIDSLMRAAPKDMTSPVKAGVPHCSRSYTILLDPK